jgi:hypothetical protein
VLDVVVVQIGQRLDVGLAGRPDHSGCVQGSGLLMRWTGRTLAPAWFSSEE